MVLGVWVMIFLFLGIPSAGDKVSALAVGLIIIVIAFQLKPKERPIAPDSMPYVERKNNQSSVS